MFPRGVRGRAELPSFVQTFAAKAVKSFNKGPRGGHFAALEEPDLYVEDVTKFFTQYR